MYPQGILFDLDNTLVDWRRSIAAYAIEFLIDAPPITAGTNSVEFLPGRDCHGWWKTRVQEIRLEVNYH